MLVKIIPDSIRKNPDAGKTRTLVQGARSATFESENPIPENFLSKVVITAQRIGGGWCQGIIINPDDFSLFLGLKGVKVIYDKGIESVYHQPLPDYLYKYENPSVKCSHCNNDIFVKDIEHDYDYDDNYFEICPMCKELDTFEKREYENIKDALKNLEDNKN